MDLRDSIKTNMKTEQQVKEEKEKAELERIQKLKDFTIHSFQNHIIETSKKGVKGNRIKGTYHLPIPVSSNNSSGEKQKTLFSSTIYYTWFFKIDSDTIIKLNEIKSYAEKENIAIFIEITASDRSYKPTQIEKIDSSKFPFIRIKGKPWGSPYLYSGDVNLCVHYNIEIN